MPHPTPSSTCPPAFTTTHAPSQQPSSPSSLTFVPDELCVKNSAREDSSSPREHQRTKHDSLTTQDSASRSAGVITSVHLNRPGPSPAAAVAAAASQRQTSQHLRLTSLGRITPACESLESPTRSSSRLSQESLSSLDYHPRRPGLDDKRISLNTFLSATTPPWSAEEINARQKMHQTSSRLLRQTDDDRPFTRVSLLSAIVSINFPTHTALV
ncbi:unnamed protein product [Aureobasidium vineae]|uniref:Uncharacterized protein n=1 Tax=Aureobasidium vineae TaxID=2773715 RepID=A0A9N8K201_9PEZI|nr:unnamed protein product [Aureobasidium vineae]